MVYKQYKRGSEWRKWDLHVHTPYTFMNNSYSCSNTEFLNKIIKENIKVIGLTNYFKFDPKEFELAKMLQQNDITVFLNLEIRLDYQNKDDDCLDMHILFDSKIEESAISKLLHNLTVNVKRVPKKCIDLESEEDFKFAVVNFDHLLEILNDESLNIKEQFLIGFLSRGKGNGRSSSNYEKIAYKSDFLIHSTDNIKNIIEDRKFWLKHNKALIQSSDAHDLSNIGSKYTWIKADPTFEGLRQIIYEPEDRVKIQEEKPEQKNPYNLIDYIQFIDSSGNFTNEKIFLNQNLNVIIGGKSNGKSILLQQIAKTINPDEVNRRLSDVELQDKEYDKIGDDFLVKWIDGREDIRSDSNREYRKIIYIPQSYLNRLADKEEEISPIDNLVEEILKNDDDIKDLFIELNNKNSENNRKISSEIEVLFENLEKYNEKFNEIKNLGDKKAIENFIKTLEDEINILQEKGGLSEDEIKKYNKLKEKYENLSKELEIFYERKKDFEKIIENEKFTFTYEFKQFIDKHKQIEQKSMHMLNKLESEFNFYIKNKIKFIDKKIKKLKEKIEIINSKLSPLLEKVKNAKSINDKNRKLKEEKVKLNQIIKIEKELKVIENNIDKSIDKLSTYLIEYYNIKKEFKKNLENKNTLSEDLDLQVVISVKNNEFNENFIEKIFNLKSIPDKYKKFEFELTDIEKLKEQIRTLIIEIIENKIPLKYQYKNKEKEIIQNLTKDWFVIHYQITYDGDTISEMSPGKKSFVLLRLIVELDKSECPLLIDQPEDDLDNRSIYNDVVKFIKNKKKERQIIIVTHNPNLVVTADAECIIVANQHGEKNKNKKYKFEYVQGSLENTFVDEKVSEILYKQGIKEHVCEILEGGEEAFENRKNKYNF